MTIRSLDGLRGFAVLLVLLSHMSLAGVNLHPVLDFAGVGKAGVYLFFALSAFLLTWQAFAAGETALTSSRYWVGYAIRRVCRIYPLYLIVLIVSFLITLISTGYITAIESPQDLLLHLGLMAGNHIYWAIPVEFKYYLLLPAVCLLLTWSASKHATLAGVLVASTLLLHSILWPADATKPNSIQLMPYLSIFLLGSFVAILCRDFNEQIERYSRIFGILGWLAIVAGIATIPAVWRAITSLDVTNQFFHKSFLLYGVIWSIAIIAAFRGDNLYINFFSLEPCRFIGRISFSIYLWHFPIVQLVNRHLEINVSIKFLLTIITTIAVSYISYRFIERPFIKWGHDRTGDWRNSKSKSL